ncbi:putative deoxyribonuclease YabD-like [Thraustotheca clavata]|uniref:Putative deoxyribonuclease YabD-like n=1 Tax=Thraustotheca clavata TaxID=74557 RepID=A0A1W0ACH5_9STRA|nr:putative deoxyribonuclease YabD-like [Thraustotheca clavata]
MLRWVDAHCHLQDGRFTGILDKVLERSFAAGIVAIGTCSCNQNEWAKYPELASQLESHEIQILPAFGIHPWYAADATSSYLVGEIGLCKSKRGVIVPMQLQEQCFRDQLQLAVDLKRTAIIHCVGAYGKLLAILNEIPLTRPVVLHSFAGAAELVPAFAKLSNVYFSVTAKQCMNPTTKTLKMLQLIPIDRLLVETDAPDQQPFDTREGLNESSFLPVAAGKLADQLGLSIDEIATQTRQTALSIFIN